MFYVYTIFETAVGVSYRCEKKHWNLDQWFRFWFSLHSMPHSIRKVMPRMFILLACYESRRINVSSLVENRAQAKPSRLIFYFITSPRSAKKDPRAVLLNKLFSRLALCSKWARFPFFCSSNLLSRHVAVFFEVIASEFSSVESLRHVGHFCNSFYTECKLS